MTSPPRPPRRTPLEAWTAREVGVPTAQLDEGALDAYRLERLNATLDWACRRSPFYRARLAPHGQAPVLASVADLAQLPFTSATEVRERGAQLLCVSQDEVKRVVTLPSSGTTGPPKRLHFSAEDQAATVDFFQRGMATLVGPGDRVLILLPGELPGSVGALLAEALRRLEVVPVPHGFVGDLPAALAVLRRARPTSLVGTPVQALALARYAEKVGSEPVRLRTALLTTDYVPPAIARALAEAWSCEIFEHYGMTEMGLGGAVECEAHAGYHLREPDLLLEVVEPSTGRVLPDGVKGELVVTTLRRRAMPLIRYRTGDLSRFVTGPCPCGARLRRLERVRGRLVELERVTQACGLGELCTPALDDALFPLAALVDYAATLRGGSGPPRLELTAFTLHQPDRALERSVEEALERSPSIGPSIHSGRLAVTVAARQLGARLLRGPEKRSIEVLDAAQ